LTEEKNNGDKKFYWAICQNLTCPKTHEPFKIPEKCPICGVPWGSELCPHTPWEPIMKSYLFCPECGSDKLVDADILQFLNVKNIKKLSNEITNTEKTHEEILSYSSMLEN